MHKSTLRFDHDSGRKPHEWEPYDPENDGALCAVAECPSDSLVDGLSTTSEIRDAVQAHPIHDLARPGFLRLIDRIRGGRG